MGTFSVKFMAGNLELDAIVTAFDHRQRFKVELVTNEEDPIILRRLEEGKWTVEQSGQRNISGKGFQELSKAIDAHLNKVYSIKNILVLTDFSEASVNAAKYAAALASRFKSASIILYHSLFAALATDIPLQNTSTQEDLQQQGLEKLNTLKNDLHLLISDETEIITRIDERILVSAVNILAEQQHLGLVVMGTTGKGSLKQTFIGSNTTIMTKECKIPLLIVPAEAKFEEIRKVVFACDLKKISETTPAQAIKTFIQALNAKLLILNVAHEGDPFNPAAMAELTALHKLWDREEPDYHYTNHENVVTGIMDFAKAQQAHMVITVPKEYGLFEGMFHRSITKKLAHHTNLPLLLFKEDH